MILGPLGAAVAACLLFLAQAGLRRPSASRSTDRDPVHLSQALQRLLAPTACRAALLVTMCALALHAIQLGQIAPGAMQALLTLPAVATSLALCQVSFGAARALPRQGQTDPGIFTVGLVAWPLLPMVMAVLL